MVKTKSNPTVSVIIPTYNRAHLLGRAIQSVLDQTYGDLELIVVDDGSADNTEEVVGSFDDRRLRYIRLSENSGGSAIPRNTGLRAARGQYIASLDDDCFWLDKNKLERQVEFFEAHPDHVLVGANSVTVDEDAHELARGLLPERDEEIRGKLLEENCFGHSSVMFRKAAAMIFGGYSQLEEGHYSGYCDDYDLWLKLGTVGKFTNLPIYGVSHVALSTSISAKDRMVLWADDIRLISKYKHKYPNYWRAISFRSAQLLNVLLYIISEAAPFIYLKRFLKSECPTCWRAIILAHNIVFQGIRQLISGVSYVFKKLRKC